ncbi:MAG: carboxylating nicotinate-nucleotide diphosphorylase [Proteobacteria bacterium]|nr:carboxylating nicotinate-nucleotide diphosphorylase [Pseudomonadota bacterium]MBU1387341.1 carboxylating nicotinate-nucleotide diphosphorylase [Pseudomonadota bacterium]MBU1544324.1 carboxylating nicotinate-nucleotide diphosphorylase [Pseudomonadota bacterium]MBU2480968.1 carboxylating nicotinate-nucleotide diphosphorylase [Pseudomonadota bacterium]
MNNTIDNIINLALFEDSGLGDITSESILSESFTGKGVIVAKQDFVLAGLAVAEKVFKLLDPECKCFAPFPEGDLIKNGEIIFKVQGDLLALLKGERVALNFLQRLSGIATITRTFMEKLEYPNVRLTDTRKTTPGLRCLEKEAVRAGGAYNHRLSLYDGILIKDNHIAVAGSIKNAVNAVRSRTSHLMKIEVEVSTLAQVQEAIDVGAEVIMLDNMDYDQMSAAVQLINGRAIVEASGNVSLETLNIIAATGVDVISCGALTHQARSVDLSMRISNI